MFSRRHIGSLFAAALSLLCLSTASSAARLELTRGGRTPVPGEAEQVRRFIRSYTSVQADSRPQDRYRFYRTEADEDRIRRLRTTDDTVTVRVLCVRVEFVEDDDTLTTGNGKMDTLGFLWPSKQKPDEYPAGLFTDPPHFKGYFERLMDGVRNYFLAQSLGRLNVEYRVVPDDPKASYQLPREMKFYGDTTSWQAVEVGLVRLMRDALKIADRDTFSFAGYDEIIIFHAGSGLQSDFGLRRDSPFDLLAGEIPPGALEAYLGEPCILVDSGRTRVEQTTVLPEMMRQDTTYQDTINILGMVGLAGTLVHEFAHLLGAYDLYDVTGVTMGVGAWSLMGYGGWLGDYGAGAPPGVIPGFLDAYHRVELGFIDPLVVEVPRESVLVFAAQMDSSKFTTHSDTSMPTVVMVPITDDEYFLIENRQVDVRKPDTIVVDIEDGVLVSIEDNEYDFFQPGSGILIWHVDEGVIRDYGPYNAINIDAKRKGVDLEEGDGVQDYDVPYWESWAPDYEIYGHPDDAFGRGSYNDRFTAETNPSSDGYMGKSFLSVRVNRPHPKAMSRVGDTVIPISIGWDLYQPGFPVDQGRSVPFLSAHATDLNQDGSKELVVVDTLGRISAWQADGTGYRFANGALVELNTPTRCAAAVGDVAGDGRLEIIAAGNDGRVRVYTDSGLSLGLARTGDRIVAAPVLADMDADGKKDIIVGSTDMKLHAWNGGLEPMPGFPVDIGAEIRAPVAVTDTVEPKIAVLVGDGRLFLFGSDGRPVDGFPLTLSTVAYYNTSQPVIADFDRDGTKEIAVVAGREFDNRLFVVGLDGRIEHESQEVIRQPFPGTPAVADVNRDGCPDIAFASLNDLFAFNASATLVDNYPFKQDSTYEVSELAGNWIIFYDVYFAYSSSPVVADLDNDMTPDFVIGSPQHGLLGFSSRDASVPRYFPLMTTSSVSAVPLVTDLDGDGDVELAVGSDNGVFYVWDLAGPADGIRWGCAFHDPCHTGLLSDAELPDMPDPVDSPVTRFFVYPNPAGEKATVRYHLGPGQAGVDLLLLDMSGEPVDKEIEARALPNADNEVLVGLGDVAPGMYVVKLTVKKGGETETRFTKLAIVR